MAASQEMTASQPTCRKHKAPLCLYCVEMEELACEGCREAYGRKKYRFWPSQEAAKEHKVVLTISREKLLKKVEGHEKARRVFTDMAKHLKGQAQQTEREMKDEFEKLHRFLREEQEARIAALKEEEERKSGMLKERIEKITKELPSILDTISTIEKELQAEDIAFLQNYKTTIDKTWRALQDQQSQPGASNFMTQLAELMKLPGQVHADTVQRMCKPPQEPELITGALIDMAKHLGNLKFRVWEKMQGAVQHTPVILDPNTAAPCLTLSEGLTSMKFCTDNPQLPDNLERFTLGILGSQCFTSGKHQWDVEVGDNSNWAVGVATQSVVSKGRNVQPRQVRGVLALCFVNGKYQVKTTHLPIPWRLQRVRVELDRSSGNVTFSDPVRNRPVFTVDVHYTEPVFPYFRSSCEEHPLRVAPERVSVSVQAPTQEEQGLFPQIFNWYL
ncbi:E3 ubiquitin-protein ligase TRIM35-like [Conger conger]|uniref:E3 ubiquitin-protein ligase TRIM35-like n=1 Tax=Conger conger TaxID=82655 RepID=UPI002A5989C0|nr:E3 ubiquitin-protein ligase TRIM35-like [Conger conger]